MSPKTGLNDNEELNKDQLMDNKELKFKLNFKIKDQLITILNDFTFLLYSQENKEKVIDKANNLMHNLIDIPLKLDIKNEIDQTNNDLLSPTLVINSKFKTEILDLLIKNKNYSILFKDNEDAKLNLINENNNLVTKLTQFPIQMLKIDDTTDCIWNNILIDDQLIAKSESDKLILQLKDKISILKADQLIAKSESDRIIDELTEENSNLKADQSISKLRSDELILQLKDKISILKADQLTYKSTSKKLLIELKEKILILEDQLKNKSSNPYVSLEGKPWKTFD